MSHRVTVEGSRTKPTVLLAAGERRTVEVTDDIRKFVRLGYMNVVDGSLDEPVLETSAGDGGSSGDQVPPADPPARNASRDDWAEFLSKHPTEFDTDGKDRGELIAMWDEAVSGAS